VVDMYSRVFFIVNALDECQISDGCLSRLLSEIFSLQIKYEANIFATSKIIPEISEKFKGSIHWAQRYLNLSSFVLKALVYNVKSSPQFLKLSVACMAAFDTNMIYRF
jgi:hypothetical protein